MEFTLLGAALSGVGAAWAMTKRRPANTVEAGFDSLLAAAFLGILAGRMTAMLTAGVNPLSHPGDLLLIRGGIDTMVTSLVATGYLLWTHRARRPTAVDALTPAILVGMAGWHTGCLWRGSCLGAQASVSWGWSLPASQITRHPVELYTAGLLLVVAFLATKMNRRPWVPTALAIIGVAGSRLITHPLRLTITTTPVWFLALATTLGAILAFYHLRPPYRPVSGS